MQSTGKRLQSESHCLRGNTVPILENFARVLNLVIWQITILISVASVLEKCYQHVTTYSQQVHALFMILEFKIGN